MELQLFWFKMHVFYAQIEWLMFVSVVRCFFLIFKSFDCIELA